MNYFACTRWLGDIVLRDGQVERRNEFRIWFYLGAPHDIGTSGPGGVVDPPAELPVSPCANPHSAGLCLEEREKGYTISNV